MLLIIAVVNHLRLTIKEPCLVCSHLISTFIETNRLSKNSSGQILQEIWRVLDSISHLDDSEIDLKAMRMNWRRFQVLASLSAGLMSDHVYLEIVTLMNEIMDVSSLVDTYTSQIKSITCLREIYYYLPHVKEHAYMILETLNPDSIRNLECIGSIIPEFTDNASSSWPQEVSIYILI